MNSNRLVLSLDGNKELQDYLAKKGPGDTCTLEVTGKIDEILPDQLVVSVKGADVVGEAAVEAAPEPEEDSESDAAMSIFGEATP